MKTGMTADEAIAEVTEHQKLCDPEDEAWWAEAALLAEVKRLRALFGSFQLECCGDWTCAEDHARKGAEALHEARAEVERLRAENAELKENASATLYHEALRMKRELDWFRRREAAMQQHPFRELPSGLYAWLLENPKPGAGT